MDWKEHDLKVDFWAGLVPKKSDIGIWELMAALVGLLGARERLRGKKLFLFADNLGDVRILAKAISSCLARQAVVAVIMEVMVGPGALSV